MSNFIMGKGDAKVPEYQKASYVALNATNRCYQAYTELSATYYATLTL